MFLDAAVEMNVEFRDDRLAKENPTLTRADPQAPQARVAEGEIHPNARRVRIKSKKDGTLTSFDFGTDWVKVYAEDGTLIADRPMTQADRDRVKSVRIVA